MRQQCPIRLNMPPRNAVLFFNSVHGVVMLCVPHQASSSMLVLRTSLSHLICVSSASQRRISTMPSQLPKSRPVYSWSIVRVCPQYWKAVICSPLVCILRSVPGVQPNNNPLPLFWRFPSFPGIPQWVGGSIVLWRLQVSLDPQSDIRTFHILLTSSWVA